MPLSRTRLSVILAATAMALSLTSPSALNAKGKTSPQPFHELCGMKANSVEFPKGSHEVHGAEAQRWIDDAAECLREGPMAGKEIIIAGYGDKPGRTPLGMKRAEAVRAALAKRNVSRTQMTAVSVRRSNDGVQRSGEGAEGGRVTLLRLAAPQYRPTSTL